MFCNIEKSGISEKAKFKQTHRHPLHTHTTHPLTCISHRHTSLHAHRSQPPIHTTQTDNPPYTQHRHPPYTHTTHRHTPSHTQYVYTHSLTRTPLTAPHKHITHHTHRLTRTSHTTPPHTSHTLTHAHILRRLTCTPHTLPLTSTPHTQLHPCAFPYQHHSWPVNCLHSQVYQSERLWLMCSRTHSPQSEENMGLESLPPFISPSLSESGLLVPR